MPMLPPQEPIIAVATPPGKSAVALLRLSGHGVIGLVNTVFKGKDLQQQKTHTAHVGTIHSQGQLLDEVLVTLFTAGHSFTKEESVEIACHGSPYIVQALLQLFFSLGVRLAQPGEFTQRAFLNGRFDLVQAEAIADLIAADTARAHQTALQQLRGGFSKQLQVLRQQLIQIGALLELELDFSDEDVAFADRNTLQQLLNDLLAHIEPLIQGFKVGNAIKNGLPILIVGKPNVGKSTLLNALLQEDRAIVSPIPGTTRDLIEADLVLGGFRCTLIDTAGLRDATTDSIEAIGIAKTREKVQKAALILYVFDLSVETPSSLACSLAELESGFIPILKIGNKLDQASPDLVAAFLKENVVCISAAQRQHLDQVHNQLIATLALDQPILQDTIVVNARHYESLIKTRASLETTLKGLEVAVSNEWLMVDVRQALHHLGEITGEVTHEDLLSTIFSQFCIGK
jgi:tRNA modification GTPase